MQGQAMDQTELSYSELNQIFDLAAVGIRIIDKDFNVRKINQTFSDMIGKPKEEVIGKKCYQVFSGVLCHTDQCPLRLIDNGENNVEIRLEKIRSDGLSIPCSINAQPLWDAQGQLIGIVENFSDISESQESAKALRESEKHLNMLVNGISDLVGLLKVETGPQFRYITVNNSFITFWGLSEDQFTGKLVQDVLPKPVAQQAISNYIQVLKTKQTLTFEERKDDGLIYESKIIPLLNARSECDYIICISHDISERKKMEEHLLKIEKLESVGMLAGGIAHDFNNILTAITGNLSLAKMKLNSNGLEEIVGVKKILSEAESASLQARNLTQQLLTFAKGGAPIVKVASIKDLLQETANFVLRGSNVRCEFLIADDLWSVAIDEGQIHQVIHNLIINADHSMPDGGIIKVYAENTTLSDGVMPLPGGNYVKICIEDKGVGIPADLLDKIFDPYFTTKQKGSGLGLTTSYSIIRKHGGDILVESQPGKGTSFYIYLPAEVEKCDEHQVISFPATVGRGKILIMDDEPMVRYVLSEMLNYVGYQVAAASNGQEAITMYLQAMEEKEPFNAVIMDLTVPGGMGGKEAIKQLQNLDPQVKAIVSSGYSNDPVMADFQNYGFSAVVSKPYSVEDLTQVLHKVID